MKIKEPRVLIAVPCMDMMHSHFVQSLIRLKKPKDCEIKFCIGSLVYTARNLLVADALKERYDYVCFIDSDMTFEADALYKLLNHNTDIVTALYYQRKAPHSPCIFSKANERTAICMNPTSDYFEVEAFGTGFCLIRTSVFVNCITTTRACFLPNGYIGEDIAFCLRAKQCGYKLMCDATVKVKHLGVYEYSEKDYETM